MPGARRAFRLRRKRRLRRRPRLRRGARRALFPGLHPAQAFLLMKAE